MKKVYLLPVTAFCALTSSAFASEFRFTSNLALSYVNSKVDSEEVSQRASDLLSFEPSIGATFQSKKLTASAKGNFFVQERRFAGVTFDLESQDEDEFFSNYDVNSNLDVIDNVLSINANARRRFIPIDTSNILISDEYFGREDLTRTDSHAVGFEFTIPNPTYIDLQISGLETKVDSDTSRNRPEGLDTSNTQLNGTFSSGRKFQAVRWTIDSSLTDTEGNINDDARSEIHEASIYFGLFGNLSIVTDYRDEENILRSSTGEELINLSYESWGVGLSWAGTAGRSFDLLYNESSEQEGEKDNFVSARINWPFSSRTSLSAEYGRRFYGDSVSFLLTHNARHLRTRINYTESVSSFSRLIAAEQDLGTFVCPIGATDIAACFQPDSLDYELQVGESFNDITQIVPEVSERTTLRKGLTGSIGYSKRRFRANLNVSRVESTFLESNIEQKFNSASLTLALTLGAKSSISWANRVSQVERDQQLGKDDIISSTFSYKYAFSRKLSTDLSFRYIDRESADNSARDLVDRRLTFKVAYKFD